MNNTERYQKASLELSKLRDEERVTRFLQLFPTLEEQGGFLVWDAARLDANRPPKLTAAELVDLIDNKRGLVQEPAARELALGMIRSCFTCRIPVGSDNKFLYRLHLDPYALIPRDRNLSYFATDGSNQPLIFRYVLGVNINTTESVQPALPVPAVPVSRRQQQNLSETSTRSAESDDDNQGPEFIFYQLGLLEANQYNWDNKEPWSQTTVQQAVKKLGEDTDPDEWTKTGFHLVARIGATSRKCEGIYAIFNMCPKNAETGEYEQVPPPTGEHQFSMARISKSLGELGYMREMEWEERIEHPVELVRVKPAGNIPGAARQTC